MWLAEAMRVPASPPVRFSPTSDGLPHDHQGREAEGGELRRGPSRTGTGGAECANVCNEVAHSCLLPPGAPCTDDGNPCTDDTCNGAGVCGSGTCTPFTAGLAQWIKADVEVTADGSNNVTSWADQSGHARDWGVSGGTVQLIPNARNGLPVVRAAASSNYLTTEDPRGT
jgi:hypothetical protein